MPRDLPKLAVARPSQARRGESSTEAGEERQVGRRKDGTLSPETAAARAPGAEGRSAKKAEIRSGLNPSLERATSAVTAMAPGAEERSIDLVSTGDPNQQWLDTGVLRWSLAFGILEED